MNKLWGLILGVCAAAPTPLLAETQPAPDLVRAMQLREDVRRMVSLARDRVYPALANIEVVTVSYWGGQERKGSGVGSGAIIDPNGYIITNYHVVDNGVEFTVRLADKREFSARLVGEDPLTDLAVLQIDTSQLDPGETLPVAEYGDSSQLEVGDYVLAMGSPLALSRSVTLGIVSNAERVFADSDGTTGEMQISGQSTGMFTRWIQHDALIQPGNSGGPLVNLFGEIVGVNALGGRGQGFAIPSNLAREVAEKLIAHGEVERSYVGVSLRSIADTGYERGVLVNAVVEDSPAARAGLKAGDVIVAVDDQPVTVRFVEQLPPLVNDIARRPVGSRVRVAYLRDDAEQTTTLTTARLLKDVGDQNVFRLWGLTAMDITEKMARNRRLASDNGVLITGVRSGGPAELAEPALRRGDIVQRVGDQDVNMIEDLIRLYESEAAADQRDPLLFAFDRIGRSHVTLVKPRPDDPSDPPRELPTAWIGVATQPVLRELAEQLGVDSAGGFRITRVYPGTTAAESQLQAGDVIMQLNGRRMRPRGEQDAGMLERAVQRLDIGADATLTVTRGGETLEVGLQLERSRTEPHEARRARNDDFELSVREITFFDRDALRWSDDVQGVLVEGVDQAGWASRAGVATRDVIQRINEYTIEDLPTFREAMKTIAAEQPERVVFVVLRGPATSFLFVEPSWTPITANEE